MRKTAIIFFLLCFGCATLQSSKIQSVPEGGEAVVFDIDGTLTPRPVEMWTVRAGAADAVWRYADKGYKIIYLSPRMPMFQSGIPECLRKNGFPDGYIFVPESLEESNNPTEFKTEILKQIIANGWQIVAAYGDSSTDFEAYATAGIPETSVFTLKREGASECQNSKWSKCLNGWKD